MSDSCAIARALREHARAEWNRFARGEATWLNVLFFVHAADEAYARLDEFEREHHHRWLFEAPMTEAVAA